MQLILKSYGMKYVALSKNILSFDVIKI